MFFIATVISLYFITHVAGNVGNSKKEVTFDRMYIF